MKKWYVGVEVETAEWDNERDWYSVSAENAIEAEEKVCEWLEENTTYAEYCAIAEVQTAIPMLIIDID